MRIAFIDDNHTVQNVIVATGMDEQTKQLFIDQAYAAHGSIWAIEIEDEDTRVFIGGTYDSERGFQPAPQPEIVEGTSEVIEEPAAMIEETAQEPEL
jgi:hypothetical protein